MSDPRLAGGHAAAHPDHSVQHVFVILRCGPYSMDAEAAKPEQRFTSISAWTTYEEAQRHIEDAMEGWVGHSVTWIETLEVKQ